MKLETSSLILRDFVMDDWPAVHRYGKELEVMKYITYRANTEADTKEFVRQAISRAEKSPRTNYQLAVVLRNKADVLIGGL